MNIDNGNNMTIRATCRELGWKVGDKFKVIADSCGSAVPGELVTLVEDDGSELPRFQTSMFDRGAVFLYRLQKIEENPQVVVNSLLTKSNEILNEDFPEEEYTGGSSEYYSIFIRNPTDPDVESYWAECNDIIEALDMNFAEGNVFKAVWRKAAARKGKVKKGYDDGLYDSEKIEFYGKRVIAQAQGE